MADRTVQVKAGATYTGLNAALAGEFASYPDLTNNNGSGGPGTLTFECYADAGPGADGLDDTAAATGTGWTVSDTCYLIIKGNSASKPGTSWSTSKYRLYTSTDVITLNVQENYTRIIDLQYGTSSGTSSYYSFQAGSGVSGLVMDSCFFYCGSTGNVYGRNALSSGTNSAITVFNSIFLSRATSGASQNATCIFLGSGTSYMYSCTVFGGYYCIRRTGGTLNVKNTYGGSAVTSRIVFSTSAGNLNVTYSASDDLTADDFGATGCQTSVTDNTTNFTSVTGGSEDLHLVSGSTLIGGGTVTSGETAPLNFDDDIAGDYRGASTWDIGADEYAAESRPGGGGAAIFNPYDEVII